MDLADQLKQPVGARAISLRIRKAIESGQFSDGDQLPTERELAENYQASRSTVRNALNMLESEGLLIRKVGSGTYVTYEKNAADDINSVVDQISPMQLIDVRVGMERQMIRLAVIHAGRRDLEELDRLAAQMEASEHDRDEFSRWDSEFHLQIARSTGNPLMVHLYETVNEVRGHAQWGAMKNLVLSPWQIRKYNIHHRDMLEGIRSRDTGAAIDAINSHMDLARTDLMGAEDRI